MKLKLFYPLLLSFSSLVSVSSGQIQAGITFGAELPVGSFNDLFNAGPGLGIAGKYALDDYLSLGANLHFNAFSGNRYHNPNDGKNWKNRASITGFTGLFEYNFSTEKLKPYMGADLGLYFWGLKYYYSYYWFNPGHPSYVYDYRRETGTELGFAPCGGIYYDLTEQLVLNANVKFHLMVTETGLNYMGINAGMFYKFDK